MHIHKVPKITILFTALYLFANTGAVYGINSVSDSFLEQTINTELIQNEQDYETLFALDLSAEADVKNAQGMFIKGLYSARSGDKENAFENMRRAEELYARALTTQEDNIMALNGLAGIALFRKQPKVASHWVEKSLAVEPLNNKTWLIKAEIALANNNTREAKKIYQQVLQRDDKFVLAYMGKAKIDLAEGNLDSASKQFKKIIKLDDKALLAYFALATIEYKKNNLQAAENYLLLAYKKSKGNKQAELTAIDKLVKWYSIIKQPEKLLDFMQKVTVTHPGDVALQTVLVKAQLLNGKNKQAEQTLRKFVSDHKTVVLPRLMLAELLAKDKAKEAEVIKLLDEVIKITPEKPDAHIIKANFLISIQSYDQAKQEIRLIERLYSNPALVKNLEGNLFLAQKDTTKAIQSYQQAYQLQNNQKLLFKIVKLMEDDGQVSAAIDVLKQEIDKQPQNIALHYRIALLYRTENNNKSAISHYEKIIALDPDNVLALNNLAWSYSSVGNPAALATAKKAYDLAPTSAVVADTYGYILFQQGEVEKAVIILQAAAKKAPLAKDIQYHLAKVYSETGKQQQAKDILIIILQDEKPFSEQENAKELQKQLQ